MNGPADVETLEAIARALVADGLATKELVMALDQLVADRTNGESLDVALQSLRAALTDDQRGRWS